MHEQQCLVATLSLSTSVLVEKIEMSTTTQPNQEMPSSYCSARVARSPWVITALFFCFCLCAPAHSSSFRRLAEEGSGVSPKVGDASSWMGNLPESVKNAPLKNLVLPGSHDSATYTLDFAATPPMEGVYQILLDLMENPFTALIARDPVQDLTLTQGGPIAPTQLESGIRAFDLRVLFNPNNSAAGLDPFYFSHSFAAVPVNETLKAVGAYMATHPTELVVFQLSVDYEHQAQTYPVLGTVVSIVQELLGSWLVPLPVNETQFFADVSLGTLVKANQRVLFSIDEDDFDVTGHWGIWPATAVNTFWPNGQSVNESVSAIDAYVYGSSPSSMPEANNGQLNLVFFTITPSDASIVENILDHLANLTNVTSLRDYAIEMRAPTLSILAKAVGQERKRVSIVSMDWPDNVMIEAVIALNV